MIDFIHIALAESNFSIATLLQYMLFLTALSRKLHLQHWYLYF